MIERDSAHVYRKDGKIYLSVSQHLQIAGLVDFSMVRPADLEYAKQRGSHVHDAVRLFLNDDLVVDSLDESYKGYVEAFIKFYTDHNLNVWDSEGCVWSDELRTAGEFDFIGTISTDKNNPALFEIKTPSVIPITTHLQVSAYTLLWNQRKTQSIFRGYGLQLKNNGKYSLLKINYCSDWFKSIVRCNWSALSAGIIPIGARSDEKLYNLCKSIIGG